MATTHDHEAKEILDTLLHRRGEVRSEAEVRPLKSQRADLLFVPHEKRDATIEPLGVLDRMTERACLIEPFSDAPSADDVRECLRKLLNHRHARRSNAPPATLRSGRGCSAQGVRRRRSTRSGAR